MDSAYFTKVSELFTKESHHSNISLALITENFFHQEPSSRDIYLKGNYIVVFKNPNIRHKLCTCLGKSTLKTFLVFTKCA